MPEHSPWSPRLQKPPWHCLAAKTHRRVEGQITYTNSHIAVKPCAGGFDLSSDARVRIRSTDPLPDGTIVGHLNEVANSADEAYLTAKGTFRNTSGTVTGNATLIAVDHGNDLNGVYVIRLAHNRGVIVANTASHQDTSTATATQPAGGHGEVGTDHPLQPHNYAVLATTSCSGNLP